MQIRFDCSRRFKLQSAKSVRNCFFCLAIQLLFLLAVSALALLHAKPTRPSANARPPFIQIHTRSRYICKSRQRIRHAFGHLPAPNAQRLELFRSSLDLSSDPTQRANVCFLTSVRWRPRDRPIRLADTRDRRPGRTMLLREPNVRRRWNENDIDNHSDNESV
jgi:hypothetical protein